MTHSSILKNTELETSSEYLHDSREQKKYSSRASTIPRKSSHSPHHSAQHIQTGPRSGGSSLQGYHKRTQTTRLPAVFLLTKSRRRTGQRHLMPRMSWTLSRTNTRERSSDEWSINSRQSIQYWRFLMQKLPTVSRLHEWPDHSQPRRTVPTKRNLYQRERQGQAP